MPRKPREVLSRCRCGCVRKTFTQGLDRAEKALYNVFAKRLNAEGTESIAREFESSVVLDGTRIAEIFGQKDYIEASVVVDTAKRRRSQQEPERDGGGVGERWKLNLP